MTKDLTIPDRPVTEADEARRMMSSLPAFSGQAVREKSERDKTLAVAAALERPADPEWISGRVLTLLNQYFVAQMQGMLTEKVAEDWLAILDGLPAWTIEKACRWWLSSENPPKERRRRPVPGDIEEVARRELGAVRMAKFKVGQFDNAHERPGVRRPAEAEDTRLERTEEERERMAAFVQERFGDIAKAAEGGR